MTSHDHSWDFFAYYNQPGQSNGLCHFYQSLFKSNHYENKTNISEVKLIFRTKIKASERLKVKCSRDAYDIFMENWDPNSIKHSEEFKLLLMNRSNSVIGISSVSKGGSSATVTDVRIIYQTAIKATEYGIIVAYNHPSRNLNPSESDTKITQKNKEACNLMDIQLLDHLILSTEGDYY